MAVANGVAAHVTRELLRICVRQIERQVVALELFAEMEGLHGVGSHVEIPDMSHTLEAVVYLHSQTQIGVNCER